MTAGEQNLQSRIETLDALFSMFKDKLKVLDPVDAVFFSSPLSDILLRAIHQLTSYEQEKDIDKLLDNALKNQE